MIFSNNRSLRYSIFCFCKKVKISRQFCANVCESSWFKITYLLISYILYTIEKTFLNSLLCDIMMSTNKNLYSEELLLMTPHMGKLFVWGFIHIDFLFLINTYSWSRGAKPFLWKDSNCFRLDETYDAISTTHLCSCRKQP